MGSISDILIVTKIPNVETEFIWIILIDITFFLHWMISSRGWEIVTIGANFLYIELFVY